VRPPRGMPGIAESSALFCRMLMHRPAWPFAIPQILDALYRLPYSVDMSS
jgi:hypothetical protein